LANFLVEPKEFITMKNTAIVCFVLAIVGLALSVPLWAQDAQQNRAVDPLPSWNATGPRTAIIAFVERVTKEGSPDFVPVEQRIAVFDNDGTLWPENPIPFQVAFVVHEVKRLLPEHPEWKSDPSVKALFKRDVTALATDHYKGLFRVIGLTHAGITTDEFHERVENWITSDKHPRFDRPYIECSYQPMIEVLAHLRANGFKTYIVSGGGMDFMRVWSERIYGIPPEHVLGSHGQVKFEFRDGRPVLVKTLDTVFIDDKEGKPVCIHQFIGRRPIAAFGNSNGDQAMLEYVTIDNPNPSLGLIVHHTDAQREYAYDAHPKSSGTLTTALKESSKRGWIVVDMKADWNRVLPQKRDSVGGQNK
jgi:hypothetical protein